ncbi:MAG: hypothetical protein HUK40_08250 [Desulfobacter sp.]|nr:hypothetical protein [Desulfobacter sp.]
MTQEWITFKKVDSIHNPEKKTRVTQPYLDAMGRGYMVSIIAPVYTDQGFAGAVGIDMTTTALVNQFLSLDKRRLMIVSDKHNIVAMNKGCASLLNISGPGKHRYLDKASENRPLDEKFNLGSSARKGIRDIGHGIASDQTWFDLTLDKKKYRAIQEKIPHLGWHLVQLFARTKD